jgi:hypothetical protein
MIMGQPIEQHLAQRWGAIPAEYRRAFLIVLGVGLLAFGFEMTNLSLHHDDLVQIFIQDTNLGHYLGRWGTGWLHYYTQGAHIMPFLQMAQGIVVMTVYGLLVAHFWGLRRTLDVALVASVLCVFPFMAQVFQYNSTMATYNLAHLLAALAVIWAVKGTPRHVLGAIVAFVLAFSIYQSVIANAATLFLVWALMRLLFPGEAQVSPRLLELGKSALYTLLAVGIAGGIYVWTVSLMDLKFDDYQGAGEAFSFKGGLQLGTALPLVLQGTRGTLLYPEAYFPDFLKKLQLLFLAGAALACLWLPKRWPLKLAALALLGAATLSPRLLQVLHPAGTYHNLTLTAYALLVAGAIMVLLRAGPMLLRNATVLLGALLLAGYLVQANWISTVGYLNTLAHYATMTQVLARLNALPQEGWDGKTVAVVGRYPMYTGYPYKRATGLASEFIDEGHIRNFALLLRDQRNFLVGDAVPASVRAYAATRTAWPHAESVGVTEGMAVVVLSAPAARQTKE